MPGMLVISGFWPTAANPISGIFVTQQVSALCRAGCSVTVIVDRVIGKSSRHLSVEELGLADQVTLIEMPIVRAPEGLSANRLALAANIRSVGHSTARAVGSVVAWYGMPQGCIVHGLRYHALAARHWSRHFSGRKIAFLHGVDPFLVRPSLPALLQPYIEDVNEFIDVVGLVGSPLRPHAEALGIDPSKTVVIANGTDLPLRADPPPRDGTDATLRIVSVSNLIPLKGIDDNIRALSQLKSQHGICNWQYRIVGDGPERGRLESLAAALGIQHHVQFLGRLAYAETMREVAGADVFSLPSWGEAFGITYLEAMARSRPAIGCYGNGAADIITDGSDGILVPPQDAEALASALQRLLAQPGLRHELGSRARLTAERYSWDENVRRVLDALDCPLSDHRHAC